MDVRDAFRILDLQPGCSPAVARSAYRARLRHHHPDTGTGDLRSLAETRRAYRAIVAAETAAEERRRPHVDVYA
jgi:curved DNA-binding protein CbpA